LEKGGAPNAHSQPQPAVPRGQPTGSLDAPTSALQTSDIGAKPTARVPEAMSQQRFRSQRPSGDRDRQLCLLVST
jgi:hypothetical protein